MTEIIRTRLQQVLFVYRDDCETFPLVDAFTGMVYAGLRGVDEQLSFVRLINEAVVTCS